jgi:hypothetical protein
VVYGFEVAADNLADVVRLAEERKLRFHGPVGYAAPSPIKESLYVLDPDGNTVELSIRRDPVSDQPQGRIILLRRTAALLAGSRRQGSTMHCLYNHLSKNQSIHVKWCRAQSSESREPALAGENEKCDSVPPGQNLRFKNSR